MKKAKKKKTKKFRKMRHLFLFKVPNVAKPGKLQVFKSWAHVINAKKEVLLTLKADDVAQSIKSDGVGNTQTCSMALCAQREANLFPHPVEGYIDWQYSRAYVVSKVDKKTGLPSECVCYWHEDEIAKLNDTKGGQAKLLQELLTGGDRQVKLGAVRNKTPSRDRTPAQIASANKKKRGPSKTLKLRGADLRYAVAQRGGVL